MSFDSLKKRLHVRILTLFITIFYYKISGLRGEFNLIFFNTLYPNFKIGNSPKIWEKFHFL